MANKTFNNVELHVDFSAHANHTDNLVSRETLNISLGKIMKWKTDFHSCVWDGNAATVNNHSVAADVPADAVFVNTTYAFTEGTTNGAFVVTPTTNGTAGSPATVPIHGLGTMAYETASDYPKLVSGKIPSSALPSYVDDVIEGYYNTTDHKFYEESTFTTEITAEAGKIYVDITSGSNKCYRWSGSAYIEIASSYTHPSYTAYASGIYKITVDALGHVSEASAVTASEVQTLVGDMVGSTASTAGTHGLVPAPASGTNATHYLRADGTWSSDPVIPADTLILNVGFTPSS